MTDREGYLIWLSAHEQQTEAAREAIINSCEHGITQVRAILVKRLQQNKDPLEYQINLLALWGLTELMLRYKKPEGVV